jgi:long-subunit fatty acid transport protein
MRRRTTSSLLVVSIALLSFLFSDVTIAGGAWLTETGGADMAMAAAGSAALAVDASSVAANPAGMVELQGNRLLITAMPLLLEIQGSGDGDTTGSINNQGGPTPAGALFATHSNGRWAAGLDRPGIPPHRTGFAWQQPPPRGRSRTATGRQRGPGYSARRNCG